MCPIRSIQTERVGAHSQVHQRARERRRFRRPKVIVDHDPAAIVEQVTVAIIDGVQKNVRAIGRAHHSVRADSSVPVPCARIRLPCYLMQNTRSKGRGGGPNSVMSGCGSAW